MAGRAYVRHCVRVEYFFATVAVFVSKIRAPSIDFVVRRVVVSLPDDDRFLSFAIVGGGKSAANFVFDATTLPRILSATGI